MIGLGTYAFFWQHSDRAPRPLTLRDELEATRELGVELFQICDFAPLDAMTDAELTFNADAARDLGITIQLGTRGINPAHLDRYLHLASIFDARLIRSMIYAQDSRPTLAQAREWLTQATPRFEDAGVTLALETYEQIPTQKLVDIVADVGSDNLGICLDPANVVAQFENPRDIVELTSPHVKNVHAKDFAFSRQDGWVGFTYSGTVMGEGAHDYNHLLTTVTPRERGIDEIVEHWLGWQDTIEKTLQCEKEWTRTAVDYLRSTP